MAARNIPGFYYDTEKKRYFKIPPKADKTSYPNLTNKIHKRKSPSLHQTTRSVVVKRPIKTLNLVRAQQHGVINGINFIHRMEINKWRNPLSKPPPFNLPLSPALDKPETLSVSQNGKYLIRKFANLHSNFIESNFIVYSVSIDADSRTVPRFDVLTEFSFYHTNFSGCDWVSVNNTHWALFAFQRDGPFNSASGTLLTYKLTELTSVEYPHNSSIDISTIPYVMQESPWCITANTSPYTTCGQFGIGGETKQHFYDVEQGKLYSCSTNNVTVLSQGFCQHSPVLLSGLRNGKALIWDLRTFPSSPVGVLFSKFSKKQTISPIVWIKPVLNDVFILIQKQNGELALWDMRCCKKCVVYNSANTDARLDLIGYKGYVTRSERVLVGFPRAPDRPVVYDVMSGEVLRNEDSFRESPSEELQCSSRFCYADNWGGERNCLEGLLESSSSREWRFLSV